MGVVIFYTDLSQTFLILRLQRKKPFELVW